ncbi:MAG: hypothetical protein V1780_00465 [Chloroflexota bacterium]
MNKKISSIFGVALSLVMALSVLAAFMPVSSVQANPGNNEWAEFNVPKDGNTGSWVLATADNVSAPPTMGPIAMAIDGTLYCYVGPTTSLKSTDYTLFKSNDGGKTWAYTGKVEDTIIDIVTSPNDAKVLYYATDTKVYKSSNAGSTFTQITAPILGGSETITSLGAALLVDAYVIIIGTNNTAGAGRVLIFDEGGRLATGWTDQLVGTYDVFGVAMAPDFNTSKQMVAIITDGTSTWVTTKMGASSWNTDIGNAELEPDNVTGANIVVNAQAPIRFPSDYDSDPDTGNTTIFVGITGTTTGDVYQFLGAEDADQSVALDLDADANVSGLDVVGTASNAYIVAGTTSAGQARVRRSHDGGTTWFSSKKEPTGGASKVYVVMADDYANTLRAWAAVGGNDGGVSLQVKDRIWNTLGLIITSVAKLNDLSPTSDPNTVFLATDNNTTGGASSIWRSGSSWQRIFSSSLQDAAGAQVDLVEISPYYNSDSAVFLGNLGTDNKLFRSTDMGDLFTAQTRATGDDITGWVVLDDQTVITGTDGGVFKTTNNGRSWGTETSVTSAGALMNFARSPDYDNDLTLLVGDDGGAVFRSTDAGKTWSQLKDSAAGMTSDVIPAFDMKYPDNATMYATDNAGGVYRYIKGTSSTWARIDNLAGSTDKSVDAGAGMVIGPDGTLYATDGSAVGDGMQRSLNPTGSTTGSSVAFPYFEEAAKTVEGTLTNLLHGLWLTPGTHQVWAFFGGEGAWTALYTWTDGMITAPVLTSPANNSSTGRADRVTLTWNAVSGATKYEIDVDTRSDFNGIRIVDGDDSSTTAYTAEIATTYRGIPLYWRVRVLAGSPLRTPRSAVWSFTTELVGGEWNPFRTAEGFPGNVAPMPGATGVLLRPTFQWNPADWATGYEVELSLNDTFTSPVASVTTANSVWVADVDLKYGTTYFWRVRAVSASSKSAWGVGTFTTMLMPVAPPAPTPPVVVPPAINMPAPVVIPPQPAPITPAYIWAIIIIGAVLVIAVVILIVKTRRVA